MIAESFVGQELLCSSQNFKKQRLHFWKKSQRSSKAEIDYLHQFQDQILPIEVKSGPGGKLKSMRIFLDHHKKIAQGLRFSELNYSTYDGIISKPLYFSCHTGASRPVRGD